MNAKQQSKTASTLRLRWPSLNTSLLSIDRDASTTKTTCFRISCKRKLDRPLSTNKHETPLGRQQLTITLVEAQGFVEQSSHKSGESRSYTLFDEREGDGEAGVQSYEDRSGRERVK